MSDEQPRLTQADLDGFTGMERYWAHAFAHCVYTDVVRFLALRAGAYSLAGLIALSQSHPGLRTPRLRAMQFWRLEVRPVRSARLTCREDTGREPVVDVTIPCTDFPLDSVEEWVSGGVVYLPSEHYPSRPALATPSPSTAAATPRRGG